MPIEKSLEERCFDVTKMDPGNVEDVTEFQTWRDDVELIVGTVCKDINSITQETRNAVTEVKESEVKTKILLSTGSK